MPVNTAANSAMAVSSPMPCAAVGGMHSDATSATICTVVNGIVCSRSAYPPW